MQTVKINAETVLDSIIKYFGKDNMDYFEKTTGKEITSYTDIMFNLVRFDMNTWTEYINTQHAFGSMEDKLITLYGKEFADWFRENIVDEKFYALAVIL